MEFLRSYLKFIVKMKIVAPLRSLFLRFRAADVNKEEWEKRLLLVNLESLGDMILFTSVLKHYKKRFPDHRVYLLIKAGTNFEKVIDKNFVDEVLTVDYRTFAVNPFYGAAFINRLRQIGFAQVVSHDFSAAEIIGKMIATEVGAKEVVGYGGMDIEWKKPFDIQQKKNLQIIKTKIFPRFTKIIRSIDKDAEPNTRLRNAISHYRAIYEDFAGAKESDYATTIAVSSDNSEDTLKKFGLEKNKYVLFNLNATMFYRRWPLFRFSKIAEFLEEQGIAVVLMGAAVNVARAEEFQKTYWSKSVNLAGKTSFPDLINLVRNSMLVFANDTSAIHLAVALRKPSICIAGGGQFGAFTNYGYSDINHWLWQKTDCYFDDWHCSRVLAPNTPAPCIEAVPLWAAFEKVKSLLEYIDKNKSYPLEKFSPEVDGKMPSPKNENKLKIIYAGIRDESYNPKRHMGYEYTNFYLTIKQMNGVEVLEYPFDPIVDIGKKKWNEDLLSLVKSEKPDLFFAFMFSDEFDKGTLDEIKKVTKSIAWFADDHWRFHNYSRYWAPHFSWVITTYSRAVGWYKKIGVNNVIRSQWAANTNLYKPVENMPPDADRPDVVFVGGWSEPRQKAINALLKAGVRVEAYGNGFSGGRVSQEEMLRLFSVAKINLGLNPAPGYFNKNSLGRLFFRRSLNKIVPDIHFFRNLNSLLRRGIPQIKGRHFEIPACGGFVITSPADDLENYYVPEKEMVIYNNFDDLVKKINYYFANGKERETIARRGHERTVSEHTWDNRFQEIFKIIGKK